LGDVELVAARFADLFNPDFAAANFAALFSVVLIDLSLSRDNAAAIAFAVAALSAPQQRRAIFYGVLIALLLRIIFASIGRQMLQLDWLLLAGGLLLFWVAWRMWDDVRKRQAVAEPRIAGGRETPKTFMAALLTIVVVDTSTSWDNVLAVAAVARHNEAIIWIGLVLSVALMAVAAAAIGRLLERYRWLPILGIAIVVFTAARMVWEGGQSVWPSVS
jgi:YjbE family integral membrane protein